MDRPVHVPLQAQLTPPATQAPPPGRWGSFHLHRLVGLRRAAWTAQPRCPRVALALPVPPSASPGPSACLPSTQSSPGWAVRGSATQSGSSDEGRLTGATAGAPYLPRWAGLLWRLCQPGCGAASHLSRQGVDVESRSSPGPPGPAAASLLARLRPLRAPPPPTRLLPAQPDGTRGASSLSSGLWSPNRVWASLGLRGCGPGGSTGLGARARRLGAP